MAFLNIKKQVPPSYTSVIGSDSPYDFPLNTMAAMECSESRWCCYVCAPHLRQRQDVFDTNLGAKESPVNAALDAMDAIDILPFGEAAYELWYRLLNSGFRIVPGGGTDSFTNWRGINRLPGAARQYVDVGGAMNWDRWVERYRQGRTFVTNGPLVQFDVNGQRWAARSAARGSYTPRTERRDHRRRPASEGRVRSKRPRDRDEGSRGKRATCG
jgi:hypothetical protein